MWLAVALQAHQKLPGIWKSLLITMQSKILARPCSNLVGGAQANRQKLTREISFLIPTGQGSNWNQWPISAQIYRGDVVDDDTQMGNAEREIRQTNSPSAYFGRNWNYTSYTRSYAMAVFFFYLYPGALTV